MDSTFAGATDLLLACPKRNADDCNAPAGWPFDTAAAGRYHWRRYKIDLGAN